MKPIKPGVGSPQWPRILLFAALSFLVLSVFFPLQEKGRVELSYTEFKRQADHGNIVTVTVKGSRIDGEFKEPLTEDLKVPEQGTSLPA